MKYEGIEKRKAFWGWIFVTPAVLLFLLFSLYPMANAFYNTFFNIKLLSLRKPQFMGIKNYIYVLSSGSFLNSIKATVIFTLGAFIPLTVFSCIFGLIITTRKRGHNFLQLMIYAPAVFSSVVAALIWMLLFDPRGLANSMVNFILASPGVDHHWLTDTAMLRLSTAAIYVWKYIGYFSIIFVTGIAKIPHSVLEAAVVDGAGALQTIRRIIMPLLRPTTVMVSIVAMLNCLKSFSTQYLFTQRGAPVEAINVVTLNIYNTAIRDLNISRACVMSVLLFLVMMALTMIRLRSSERDSVRY
ncbi:MAG: sugar ABC transporter permease [Treponema sp.]|jgi:multiple sugar transport system permease protein|nr:sugar ABC transporter permease [Treponema sp.]